MGQGKLPRTYTIKQIAKILRVHEDTIRKQIRKGNIKAVKVARHYLILEDEANRILKEGWKGSHKRLVPEE